jgi:indole-3-glycerol phosphate synthase
VATHTAPVLDRIVESRRIYVNELKAGTTVEGLAKAVGAAPQPRDFHKAISGRGVALIAECKQRSPSGGVLQAPYDPAALARRYAANGAAAISVLTEPLFFGGAPDDLQRVRAVVNAPLLCKDFIVDPVQLMTARAVGADAVLLIVAILADAELASFHRLATDMRMAIIVEVHTPEELERALGIGARIIGINNRDLTRMTTDKATTARLLPLIPAGRLVISESGIESRADIDDMQRLGVDAILVGEALLRASDVDAKVRELSGR